jgi:4'-phosphopantetheinyl transferase EntD
VIERLLPAPVVSVAVAGDEDTGYLLPAESAQFGWAVERRRREFTAARTCARRGLRLLGLPETPILRGPKREPLWPAGVVGSITHCPGYCAAALARELDVLAIGIDAEIHAELPPGVLQHVAVASERERLAAAPPGPIRWDRLLFSAKESVFKAWFPLTRRWLGFEGAAVTFDPKEQTFHARLLVEPPTVDGRVLRSFDGRFLVCGGFVLTAVVVPR